MLGTLHSKSRQFSGRGEHWGSELVKMDNYPHVCRDPSTGFSGLLAVTVPHRISRRPYRFRADHRGSRHRSGCVDVQSIRDGESLLCTTPSSRCANLDPQRPR